MRIAKLLNCYIAKKRSNNHSGFTPIKSGFTLVELLIVIAIVGVLSVGVATAINVVSTVNKANLAKAKTFAASVENNLAISQVGKWSFNDQSNPGQDTSGYGNDGILIGGATWKDATACGLGLGGCLSFDGVDDYVNTTNILDFSSNRVTFGAWIKIRGDGGTDISENTVINIKDAYDYQKLGWKITTNKAFCQIDFSDNSAKVVDGSTNLALNTWYYLTCTYDGSNAVLYLNGIRDGTPQAKSAGLKAPGYAATIGALKNGASSVRFFNGWIDEVQIYSQALSFAQIQQLYAQGLIKHQLTARN